MATDSQVFLFSPSVPICLTPQERKQNGEASGTSQVSYQFLSGPLSLPPSARLIFKLQRYHRNSLERRAAGALCDRLFMMEPSFVICTPLAMQDTGFADT